MGCCSSNQNKFNHSNHEIQNYGDIYESERSYVDSEQLLLFKIVLIGNQTVGKTQICGRYADEDYVFVNECMGTTGVEFYNKIHTELNHTKISI